MKLQLSLSNLVRIIFVFTLSTTTLLAQSPWLSPNAGTGASPSDQIVTGPGTGANPLIRTFTGLAATPTSSFFAYPLEMTAGVRVATGDVNGDGFSDIITGPGPAAAAHVKIFDGVTGAEIRSFLAYSPSFTGGVFVAAGDVDGDGLADIITGTDAGVTPHVKVFSGRTGSELASFLAFPPNFSGGVRVAAGDLTGDGRADIIVGAGSGINGHVKVIDGATNAEIRSFFAFSGFSGGIFVGAGDVNGDGRLDIIVGAEANGHVKVFDGNTHAEVRSILVFPGFNGQVNVAGGDFDHDGFDDIVVSGKDVQIRSGRTSASLVRFNSNTPGSVYVAASPMTDLAGSAR